MIKNRCADRIFMLSTAIVVTFQSSTNQASADLLGPTPYLQASDSPFAAFTFNYFHLEDFEDGILNVPGVTRSAGNVIGPGPAADSVDADDGSIDGSGNGGRSLFVAGGSLTFTFDPSILGGLPTHAGIVRTDGGSTATGPHILFEAFGPGMNSLGTISSAFGDGVSNGTTAEDRFFGWFDPNGILAIRIPSAVYEVDHLQYGASVPEPSAVALLVCVFAVFSAYKFCKAALRSGIRRRSLYAVAVLLCRSSTAGAIDFVIDQQHYTTGNFINEIGLCCGAIPVGQEFTPTFNTMDTVDLLLDGFRSDLFLNIREESITGPILASSANAVRASERGPLGRFSQFHFGLPVSVLPGETYVIEIVSPVEIEPPQVYVVNDGAFQTREEHRYTRGRMISGGVPSEDSDIAFRTGSRRLSGTVYETEFEYTERLTLSPGPVAGQRDWRSIGSVDAVSISAIQPSEWPNGGQAIQIKGTGLVSEAGVLNAAAIRSSDLDPIANGNPIVFMEASVRLDGPSTSANGGSDDDLISANLGVTDGAGATIAELILSSNGNAYAFAGDHTYSFETPATFGEYHTLGLRFDYIARRAEYFVDGQRLGALPFAANVRARFGEPFLALSALDTPRLNPASYSAWFDDFSIQQMSVPEPASAAMLILAAIGLLPWVRVLRSQKPLAACSLIIVSFSFLASPGPVHAAMFHVANVSQLIDAIDAANQNSEPDSIGLAAGTTFTLAEVNRATTIGSIGLPTITANEKLTIFGNGGVIERSAAASTPAFRLFDVAAGASLSLENVTLQGGLVGIELAYGGAIYNSGNLALTDVTVQNNVAQGRNGSIGVRGAGGPGGWALGGGIYSTGSLVLENSTLRNNQAQGGAGGASFCRGSRCHLYPGGRGGWGEGGGIYVAGGTATLLGSIVTENDAQGGAGGGGLYDGVPGRGYGGGINITSAQVVLDELTLADLTGNTASTSDPNIYGPFEIIEAPNIVPGDYNFDAAVDAADYVVWRKNDGAQPGHDTWRAHFGRTAGSGAAGYPLGASAEPLPAAVPEPRTCTFVASSLFLIVHQQRRRRRSQTSPA